MQQWKDIQLVPNAYIFYIYVSEKKKIIYNKIKINQNIFRIYFISRK